MNREQLMDRIARNAGVGKDDHATGEYELIGDMIDEAIIDILSRTRVNIRPVDIELTAAEQEYTIHGALRILNLFSGERELLEVVPGDIGRVGGRVYAIPGYNRFIISWVPAVGDELQAWYTPVPEKMSDPTDDPSAEPFGAIPPVFHDAIVNYGSWKISDIVGDVGSGRGEKYRILYEGRDGDAPIGSNIGKILAATNRRARGSAEAGRFRRGRDVLVGDHSPDYWQG